MSSIRTTRRDFLRTAALGAAALAAPLAARAAAKRPNIVFIFSDDHAYQAISAYGEKRKLVETPNIDRIGREGIRFDRCVVPNSICGPSRATILTGKYNHLNGFYNNSNCRFDGAQTTFPKLMQAAGYQTAIVGKWHLVSDPTGFDHWHILPGQGIYYNPPMIRNGENVRHEGYTTDIITDLSIEWLKGRDKTKPFLLMAQHKAPHREWSPALRHLGHDKDRQYPEPETLFDDYGGDRGLAWRDQDMTLEKTFTETDAKLKAPGSLTPEQKKAWDAYYEPRNEAFRKANPTGKDLVRWRYNRYMHDYLGCIRSVDESVGRILDALEKEGLAENTIVVYSADQGFYLGEHGWFDKRWIVEESLRAPLLVRWPGVTKPGGVSPRLVSNLDFAETFLDAAGVPVPAEMQGRSLVPLLKGGDPADWRKSFYYHYYEYPVPHRVRPHYGVVTERYKLVHYYKPDVDDWELYDREKDPLETRNFIRDPAYAATVTELKAELQRLRKEVKETEPPPREAYGNRAFDGETLPPKPGGPAPGGGPGRRKKPAGA
jgi:arylsulfatase A-like enzyme